MLVAHQCVNTCCERPRGCFDITYPEPRINQRHSTFANPTSALSLYPKNLHLWPETLTLDAPPHPHINPPQTSSGTTIEHISAYNSTLTERSP